jgi:hypothetical protein
MCEVDSNGSRYDAVMKVCENSDGPLDCTNIGLWYFLISWVSGNFSRKALYPWS